MRVVIECNVVVSAAHSRRVCGRVVVEALGRRRIVLADDIVQEYRTRSCPIRVRVQVAEGACPVLRRSLHDDAQWSTGDYLMR